MSDAWQSRSVAAMVCPMTANRMNYEDARTHLDQRLRDIALPAGAATDGWCGIHPDDGDAIRSLEWSRHDAEHDGRAIARVSVGGWQCEDGSITRHVGLFDVTDQLTAHQARVFAAALMDAADALDRLS